MRRSQKTIEVLVRSHSPDFAKVRGNRCNASCYSISFRTTSPMKPTKNITVVTRGILYFMGFNQDCFDNKIKKRRETPHAYAAV